MGCPECGCEIITDGVVPVCYDCGTAIQEHYNEESDLEEEDSGDDFEDLDRKSQKDGKPSVEDGGESVGVNLTGSNSNANSEKVSASSKDESKGPAGSGQLETVRVRHAPTCKSCGGTNLTSESIHNAEHLVCEDCGAFSEEVNFVASEDYAQKSGTASSAGYKGWSRTQRPRFIHGATESQINKGKIHGIKTIRSMSSQLNWHTQLTDQSIYLYEKLYPHKNVKHTSNVFKDALCVACMYSVARENGENITLKTLMSLKKARMKFVSRALKLLKSIQKKPLAHQTVSSLPEHILAAGKFSTKFLDKVTKLVRICEKGFVTQGRDHSHVVIAVAHLVWLSEDYRQRKAISVSRFCSDQNLKYGRHCYMLQKHIKELFLKLARQLPWVLTPVTEKNYLHYLDNIVSHGLSLVSKASEMDSGTKEKSAGSSQCSSVDEEMPASPAIPHLAPPCMKLARTDVRAESPPRLPDHITGADLDKEDLCDSEFSDQEIDSYILSAEEVSRKGILTQHGTT